MVNDNKKVSAFSENITSLKQIDEEFEKSESGSEEDQALEKSGKAKDLALSNATRNSIPEEKKDQVIEGSSETKVKDLTDQEKVFMSRFKKDFSKIFKQTTTRNTKVSS